LSPSRRRTWPRSFSFCVRSLAA